MQSLAHLSDDELVAELTACCLDTRRSNVRTLLFLAEVETRQLYLRAAASSLREYCRRMLRLRPGAAPRTDCVASAGDRS